MSAKTTDINEAKIRLTELKDEEIEFKTLIETFTGATLFDGGRIGEIKPVMESEDKLLERYDKRVDDLVAELDVFKTDRLIQIGEKKKVVDGIRFDLYELRKDKEELQKNISESEDGPVKDGLETQLADIEKSITDLGRFLANSRRELKDYRKETESDISEKESEIQFVKDDLHWILSEHRDELTDRYNDKLLVLGKELIKFERDIKQKIDADESFIYKIQQNLTDLTVTKTKLQDELRATKDIIKEKTKEKKQAKDKVAITRLDPLVKYSEAELAKFEDELAKDKEEIVRLDTLITESREKLAEFEGELVKTGKSINTTGKLLEKSKTELDLFEKRAEVAKSRKESHIEAVENELEWIEKDMNRLDERTCELEKIAGEPEKYKKEKKRNLKKTDVVDKSLYEIDEAIDTGKSQLRRASDWKPTKVDVHEVANEVKRVLDYVSMPLIFEQLHLSKEDINKTASATKKDSAGAYLALVSAGAHWNDNDKGAKREHHLRSAHSSIERDLETARNKYGEDSKQVRSLKKAGRRIKGLAESVGVEIVPQTVNLYSVFHLHNATRVPVIKESVMGINKQIKL